MRRAKAPADPPPRSDLFGEPETQPEGKPASHTRREGTTRTVLERMSQAFRSLEAFRTLAWMRIENGKREEALEALRGWEQAVRGTREDYERLTR